MSELTPQRLEAHRLVYGEDEDDTFIQDLYAEWRADKHPMSEEEFILWKLREARGKIARAVAMLQPVVDRDPTQTRATTVHHDVLGVLKS